MTTNRGNHGGAEPHESSHSSRPSLKPDPKTVADQFSHQYYTVFSNYPRYLYRFYDTESTMTVSEVLENGSMKCSTAESQEGIHDLVLEMFEDTTVKLGHVLPQFSQNGGIVMQVTGTLTTKGVERSFAQSFFLAVQDKGFYVLNDILHITPILPGVSPRRDNPPAVAPPVQTRVNAPRKVKEASRAESSAPVHVQDHAYGQANGHAGQRGLANLHSGMENDTPAKSYAQTLKVPAAAAVPNGASKAAEARVQRPGTPNSPVETPPSQKAPSVGANANANGNGGAGITSHFPHKITTSSFPRNSSVFVRDIPPTVDENALRQAFAQFGDVTNVVIRNGRRDLRFAFVDYATTEAMDECLRNDVNVGGRRLFVEEKKPLVLRNKPRFRRAGSGSPGPHDEGMNGGSGGSNNYY